MALYKILRRALPIEGLTRTDVIVSPLPPFQSFSQAGDVKFSIIHLIELLCMSAMGTLYIGV